jgi:hypothetical protein
MAAYLVTRIREKHLSSARRRPPIKKKKKKKKKNDDQNEMKTKRSLHTSSS